jgi:hypothetical protein
MIVGSRIGKKTDRERRLTEVAKGVFVAKDANQPSAKDDYFEQSPILESPDQEHSSIKDTTASE